MFATVLLILLVILCFWSRHSILPALVALTLGVTIASSGGPMATTTKAAADGLRSGLSTISQTLFGSTA
jgi:hypothetical protein